MTDAGFFRGTSAAQDNRFSDKSKKLLKQLKFSEILSNKVDLKKVNLDFVKPWIQKQICLSLGIDDEVVYEYVINQLEQSRFPDGRTMQINITGFLDGKRAREFMNNLWKLLLDAAQSKDGIPEQLVLEKAEEIKEREAKQNQSAQKSNGENAQSLNKHRQAGDNQTGDSQKDQNTDDRKNRAQSKSPLASREREPRSDSRQRDRRSRSKSSDNDRRPSSGNDDDKNRKFQSRNRSKDRDKDTSRSFSRSRSRSVEQRRDSLSRSKSKSRSPSRSRKHPSSSFSSRSPSPPQRNNRFRYNYNRRRRFRSRSFSRSMSPQPYFRRNRGGGPPFRGRDYRSPRRPIYRGRSPISPRFRHRRRSFSRSPIENSPPSRRISPPPYRSDVHRFNRSPDRERSGSFTPPRRVNSRSMSRSPASPPPARDSQFSNQTKNAHSNDLNPKQMESQHMKRLVKHYFYINFDDFISIFDQIDAEK